MNTDEMRRVAERVRDGQAHLGELRPFFAPARILALLDVADAARGTLVGTKTLTEFERNEWALREALAKLDATP